MYRCILPLVHIVPCDSAQWPPPVPPLQICRMLELSRSGLEDQEATVPLPPSWEIQDERKMMTLLVTTMLKCYLMVSSEEWSGREE